MHLHVEVVVVLGIPQGFFKPAHDNILPTQPQEEVAVIECDGRIIFPLQLLAKVENPCRFFALARVGEALDL
jgi:hypothetical protein